MNVAITPTAEALLEQLIALGQGSPEVIIEQALQALYQQQAIDTTLGFPELAEAAIVEENEQRWATFQQNPSTGISQADVEARLSRRGQLN
jgi:hypothetical protein